MKHAVGYAQQRLVLLARATPPSFDPSLRGPVGRAAVCDAREASGALRAATPTSGWRRRRRAAEAAAAAAFGTGGGCGAETDDWLLAWRRCGARACLARPRRRPLASVAIGEASRVAAAACCGGGRRRRRVGRVAPVVCRPDRRLEQQLAALKFCDQRVRRAARGDARRAPAARAPGSSQGLQLRAVVDAAKRARPGGDDAARRARPAGAARRLCRDLAAAARAARRRPPSQRDMGVPVRGGEAPRGRRAARGAPTRSCVARELRREIARGERAQRAGRSSAATPGRRRRRRGSSSSARLEKEEEYLRARLLTRSSAAGSTRCGARAAADRAEMLRKSVKLAEASGASGAVGEALFGLAAFHERQCHALQTEAQSSAFARLLSVRARTAQERAACSSRLGELHARDKNKLARARRGARWRCGDGRELRMALRARARRAAVARRRAWRTAARDANYLLCLARATVGHGPWVSRAAASGGRPAVDAQRRPRAAERARHRRARARPRRPLRRLFAARLPARPRRLNTGGERRRARRRRRASDPLSCLEEPLAGRRRWAPRHADGGGGGGGGRRAATARRSGAAARRRWWRWPRRRRQRRRQPRRRGVGGGGGDAACGGAFAFQDALAALVVAMCANDAGVRRIYQLLAECADDATTTSARRRRRRRCRGHASFGSAGVAPPTGPPPPARGARRRDRRGGRARGGLAPRRALRRPRPPPTAERDAACAARSFSIDRRDQGGATNPAAARRRRGGGGGAVGVAAAAAAASTWRCPRRQIRERRLLGGAAARASAAAGRPAAVLLRAPPPVPAAPAGRRARPRSDAQPRASRARLEAHLVRRRRGLRHPQRSAAAARAPSTRGATRGSRPTTRSTAAGEPRPARAAAPPARARACA